MLAGMWRWQELPGGSLTQNFLVLTTAANDIMKPIHDRMPVVLDPFQLDQWMKPSSSDFFKRVLFKLGMRDDSSTEKRTAFRRGRLRLEPPTTIVAGIAAAVLPSVSARC
jgi:putative SOS response-associated peptidase YedK